MVDLVVNTLEEYLRQRLMVSLPDPPSYGDRIYPLRMPSTNQTLVFPLLVYKRISAPRQFTQDTVPGTPTLVEPRVQYSIWAKTYQSLVVAQEEVIARLNGWKDSSVGIDHCLIMFELDQWEEQTGMVRKMLDAQVGWKGN